MSTDQNTPSIAAIDIPAKRGPGRPRKGASPPIVPLEPPNSSDPPTMFPPPPGVIGPNAPDAKGHIVTVDLGNGTTSVAYRNAQGQIVSVPDKDGLLCTPTGVGFDAGDPDKPVFGRTAMNLRRAHPEWVCTFAKRARGKGGVPAIVDKNGRIWTTDELESLFVKWRLDYAEQFIGEGIVGALITVPADFGDGQRRASLAVIEHAGYAPVGAINEPTAALLRYALGKDGFYFIIDVGRGTSDVTVVQVQNGDTVSILASAGRSDMGAAEFQARILQRLMDHAAQQGVVLDPAADHRALVLMEGEAETAACDLSSVEEVSITFQAKGQLFDTSLTRRVFEEDTADLCQSIRDLVDEAMAQAQLQPDAVNGVVLVGGGSRMPCVRRIAESMFGPEKILTDIDLDKAVSMGAVEAIGLKLNELKASGDTALVNQVHDYELKSTLKAPSERSASPIGVRAVDSRTGNEVFAPIIPRNTTLPVEKTCVFGLLNGDKGTGDTLIVVLQGDPNASPDKARVLATFSLRDLPAGPTEKRIEVKFAMDASGLVQVHAKDLFSNREIVEQVNAADAVTKQQVA